MDRGRRVDGLRLGRCPRGHGGALQGYKKHGQEDKGQDTTQNDYRKQGGDPSLRSKKELLRSDSNDGRGFRWHFFFQNKKKYFGRNILFLTATQSICYRVPIFFFLFRK